MLLYDIIKGKTYKDIELRLIVELPDGDTVNILGGKCSYVDDVLKSEDGDSYSLIMPIDFYQYNKEKDILYIYQYNIKALGKEEFDKYLKDWKKNHECVEKY